MNDLVNSHSVSTFRTVNRGPVEQYTSLPRINLNRQRGLPTVNRSTNFNSHRFNNLRVVRKENSSEVKRYVKGIDEYINRFDRKSVVLEPIRERRGMSGFLLSSKTQPKIAPIQTEGVRSYAPYVKYVQWI